MTGALIAQRLISVFHKAARNLYRLESSETYYALFKRGGKQIRNAAPEPRGK